MFNTVPVLTPAAAPVVGFSRAARVAPSLCPAVPLVPSCSDPLRYRVSVSVRIMRIVLVLVYRLVFVPLQARCSLQSLV